MSKTMRLTQGTIKTHKDWNVLHNVGSSIKGELHTRIMLRFKDKELEKLRGKKIIRATLYMYMSGVYNFNQYDNISISGEYYDSVNENISTLQGVAQKGDFAVNCSGRNIQWISGCLTDIVKKYIDGTITNWGLEIIPRIYYYADISGQYILLNSFSASSNQPYLEVEYEDILPNKPNNLSPTNDKYNNRDITLSWGYTAAYNDDNQYKYDLQYSLDNGQHWTSKSEITSRTSYTMPANTFIYDTDIMWKVRVYNKSLLISEWVESSFHIIGKPRTPIITNDEILNTPEFSITWDDINQASYKIKILEEDEILLDTKEIVGNQNEHKVDITLENNKQYIIKLAIKNQYGIWSDEATKTIRTIYPEPAQPDIKLTSNNMCGTILITCIKKSGVLETHHFEVYRKDKIHGEYIKIADDIDDTYTYTDYSIKSGKTYYYKIRAVAEGGQYKDSTETNKAAFVKGSQLALTSDYSNGINLRYNRTLQVKYQLNRQTTNFDGREKPVAEYGEHLSKYFSISFLVRDNEDIQKIEDILTASETILYRDDRGRKIYGTVTQLNLNDDRKLKYNLTFTLQEVDFSEVV